MKDIRHFVIAIQVIGLFSDLTASNSSKKENSGGRRESSGGGDSGGGGSSGKPPGDDWWKNLFENPQQIVIAAALAGATALFLLFSGIETREINWQEFRTKYLERGEVRFLKCFFFLAVTKKRLKY